MSVEEQEFAQVCRGFNKLKPNYTYPTIALYEHIESTEPANESSHFSRVNKKIITCST